MVSCDGAMRGDVQSTLHKCWIFPILTVCGQLLKVILRPTKLPGDCDLCLDFLFSEMMQILEAIFLYSSFQTKTVLCCRVCLPCECNRLSQFTKCLDFFQTALLCVAN